MNPKFPVARHAGWLLLPLLAALVAAQAAGRDALLLDAAVREQPALIATLKDMVQIESPSADAAGLNKMADYIEARLRELGAVTERRGNAQGPGDIVIGSWAGTGTRRFMLMAHMDTIYPVGTLQAEPYRIEGNRIYGPGIADDKGGIALALHAVKLLHEAGWRDYAALTVLFNSDEEIGSRSSGDLIADLAAEHDYVFSCEPTPDKPEGLLLGTSGVGTVVMQVRGRSAHAGAAPDKGRSAVVELSHQILQTQGIAQAVPGAQLNWTLVSGGTVRNQIPESAQATGDMRVTTADGFDRIEAALKERIQNKRIPDTETSVAIRRGRPPFVATPVARELARKAQGIYAEIDRELALIPLTGGGTDAGFAARSGRAVVLESFGLAGANYHARDEYITIDSIVPRLYLLSRLMQEAARPCGSKPSAAHDSSCR